ncbi:MAG: DNA-binding protein [Microbacteriaceae bacterium]|nr:DNA-binding protein [Microbacteriaceae bacterium]
MFVITADQIDSRHTPDVVDATIRALSAVIGSGLKLPIDRTAGDEIQMLVEGADHALAAILFLCRDGRWSVGCGLGTVNTPLPANAREASGDAFVSARDAVTAAKKRETRFALRAVAEPNEAADTEALIDLLLQIRGRRSAEGWAVFDLLAAGLTQTESAKRLGITPQAASKRARTAAIRAEFAAIPPLERRLASANESAEGRTDS